MQDRYNGFIADAWVYLYDIELCERVNISVLDFFTAYIFTKVQIEVSMANTISIESASQRTPTSLKFLDVKPGIGIKKKDVVI